MPKTPNIKKGEYIKSPFNGENNSPYNPYIGFCENECVVASFAAFCSRKIDSANKNGSGNYCEEDSCIEIKNNFLYLRYAYK